MCTSSICKQVAFLSYTNGLSELATAKERLRNAIELDKDFRELALDDEDLKPLWDWLAGLE